MGNAKGMKALHDNIEIDRDELVKSRREPSASDGVIAALRELGLTEEPGFPTGGALSAEQVLAEEEAKLAKMREGNPPMTASEIEQSNIVARARFEAAHLDGTAEQPKPIDREPSPAPSLYVPGMEAIKQAGAATEADRVREYGLLAEIEAKLSGTRQGREDMTLQLNDASDAVSRCERALESLDERHNELEKQRAETVDRIVKLNQTAIDHEAARLRRGQ